MDAKEFRLAQICALHIVIHGDELDEIIRQYESRGHFDEIISVLGTYGPLIEKKKICLAIVFNFYLQLLSLSIYLAESGLGLERAHVGMFTELAILYSKYKPDKLEEHLKLFHGRINIPKVLRICQANAQWKELTYLYKSYEEYDNAAMTMINHPVEAWEHNEFRSVIAKVNNLDICYKVKQKC